ncbi:hypothetical protein JOQ06_027993, partial [Pogonophryne albipinna]
SIFKPLLNSMVDEQWHQCRLCSNTKRENLSRRVRDMRVFPSSLLTSCHRQIST